MSLFFVSFWLRLVTRSIISANCRVLTNYLFWTAIFGLDLRLRQQYFGKIHFMIQKDLTIKITSVVSNFVTSGRHFFLSRLMYCLWICKLLLLCTFNDTSIGTRTRVVYFLSWHHGRSVVSFQKVSLDNFDVTSMSVAYK